MSSVTFRQCGPGWSLQGQDCEGGQGRLQGSSLSPTSQHQTCIQRTEQRAKSGTTGTNVHGQRCWIPVWEQGANLCRAPCYCSSFSSTEQEPPPPPSASLKQRGVWQHRSPGLLRQTALSQRVTGGGMKLQAETLCHPLRFLGELRGVF